jgi:hypothetical protein
VAKSAAFKVRLEDDVEVGPLDAEMLRSWWSQGMVKRDTPVRQVSPTPSKRWIRLGDAFDISDWGGAGGTRGRGRRGAAPDEDEDETTQDGPERWRFYVAGLILLSIAGVSGYFAFSPTRLLPAFQNAPWREIALGFLAIALLLVRGWEAARKTARVLVCALSFAPFALAAPFVVQGFAKGFDVAALLTLAFLWVLASGLFFLLAGRSMATRSIVLCLVWIVLGALGAANFGLSGQPLVAAIL